MVTIFLLILEPKLTDNNGDDRVGLKWSYEHYSRRNQEYIWFVGGGGLKTLHHSLKKKKETQKAVKTPFIRR